MAESKKSSGSDLFIVDNSDADWKVRNYLHDWCGLSKAIDIATGYFEIGSLLALDGEWQKVDQIRILMGDEVSMRTKQAFEHGVQSLKGRLDDSIEAEKEKNDFLRGVPAIVDAIAAGKIVCRVYRKRKFHAKAHITHARMEVVGSSALVGSSNFTFPGLTENIELNVQITGRPVNALQEWYERHWEEAEDVTPEILQTIERHVRDYSPFEVYAQSLHHLFRDAPSTAKEWEERPVELGGSQVFKALNRYQQTGYRNLIVIADSYGGAFLCDGVGLGKTFIGMMLLERLVRYERKKVALVVPKSGRTAVWERSLERYCPGLLRQAFQNLRIINHTDITRQGSQDVNWPALMDELREEVEAVVIDEAHHFRNPGVQVDVEAGSGRLVARKGKRPSRYRRLYHMLAETHAKKQLYLLTATPVNNHINDLRHMIELFSRRRNDYFGSKLGIQSLRGHFRKLEKQIEARMHELHGDDDVVETTMSDAEDILEADKLFESLVVQRSRAYVQKSQEQEGGDAAIFPKRNDPKVAEYNVRKTYGKLLDMVETAFRRDKPLFRLGIYYPYAYVPEDEIATAEQKIEANRQKQVVGLVRTNFLKRFESSASAFESSCERLFLKLLAWARVHAETAHEKDRLAKVELKYEKVIGRVKKHVTAMERRQLELDFSSDDDETPEEDIIAPEMLDAVEEIERDQFDVPAILNDTVDDLDQVAEFLEELQKFQPRHDDKLRALIELLKSDSTLKKHKVLIFTEFADTARYLAEQLEAAGIAGVERIDGSTTSDNRLDVIERFSPYYNGTSSEELKQEGRKEIRVVLSTDVLSEGLNLQDATRLINYDLHWNPVRLMQRIGRVDRRMDAAIEARLVADHPDQKQLRGDIAYWNFLPPDDLERLLALYDRVAHKTLRISRVFGIEGQKLLRPEDDFEALKNFNEKYHGVETARERLRLEYEGLLGADPQLESQLDGLPGRIFSGRSLDQTAGDAITGRAVFLCYALPGRDAGIPDDAPLFEQWNEDAGEVRWYLLDLESGKILEDPTEVAAYIRSAPDTPRRIKIDQVTLIGARKTIEKHIHRSYLRAVDAPAKINGRPIAWMELT